MIPTYSQRTGRPSQSTISTSLEIIYEQIYGLIGLRDSIETSLWKLDNVTYTRRQAPIACRGTRPEWNIVDFPGHIVGQVNLMDEFIKKRLQELLTLDLLKQSVKTICITLFASEGVHTMNRLSSLPTGTGQASLLVTISRV